jgi:uracil-DNA glycosylase
MGEVAAGVLLGGRDAVVRRRGRFHGLPTGGVGPAGILVAVTFHPRFLLAQPEPSRSQLKQAAWQDLQMIQRRLRQLAGTRG